MKLFEIFLYCVKYLFSNPSNYVLFALCLIVNRTDISVQMYSLLQIKMTKNKEELFEAYIKSCHNILADRVLDEIHLCKQDEKWQSQTSDKDRNQCIDNSLIDPGIVKKYAHIKLVKIRHFFKKICQFKITCY